MIKQLFINIWQKITHFPKWYVGLYKGKRWYTKTLLTIVSTIVAIFLYFGMVDINFLWLFGKSPGFAAIKKPPTNEASIIFGRETAYLFSPFHNRDLWITHNSTSGHNMVLELLLSTDQPSFCGFSNDPQNPYVFSNKLETVNSIEIQRGILDFAEMFTKYAGHMSISGRDAMAPLMVLYDNPKWIRQCLDSSSIRMNIE